MIGPALSENTAQLRAELVRHDDAGHHAHGEHHGEDLQPVLEEIEIQRLAGLQPQRFEHREKTCQPDRERREDEVKADRESELDAGEQKRVGVVKHACILDCGDGAYGAQISRPGGRRADMAIFPCPPVPTALTAHTAAMKNLIEAAVDAGNFKSLLQRVQVGLAHRHAAFAGPVHQLRAHGCRLQTPARRVRSMRCSRTRARSRRFCAITSWRAPKPPTRDSRAGSASRGSATSPQTPISGSGDLSALIRLRRLSAPRSRSDGTGCQGRTSS